MMKSEMVFWVSLRENKGVVSGKLTVTVQPAAFVHLVVLGKISKLRGNIQGFTLL